MSTDLNAEREPSLWFVHGCDPADTNDHAGLKRNGRFPVLVWAHVAAQCGISRLVLQCKVRPTRERLCFGHLPQHGEITLTQELVGKIEEF